MHFFYYSRPFILILFTIRCFWQWCLTHVDFFFLDGVRTLKYNNGSYKIEQTVPDYFSSVVLQRRNVLKQEDDLMNVKFSVAFNLAIVWIIIFLSLSKGELIFGLIGSRLVVWQLAEMVFGVDVHDTLTYAPCNLPNYRANRLKYPVQLYVHCCNLKTCTQKLT